jgi:two-component system, chemotaxis family, sensor kinase CheA
MESGDLLQLQASFHHEAADLLADLGVALLLLEQDPCNADVVNRVFRAMHTLKGSGASAGFRRLANFVHHVEEVFNRIRNHQLESTPELIDATLKACDCCAMLLELGSTDSDTPLPLETEVLTAIRPFLPEMDKAAGKKQSATTAPSGPARYKIGFRPNREIFFSGTDPASLLLELTDLGKLEIRCNQSELLSEDEFDPEKCYLNWEVSLESLQPEAALRAVFQFVEDECGVSIERREPASAAGSDSKSKHKDARFHGAAEQCFTALASALEQCHSGDEKQGLSTAHRAAQMLISTSKAHGHAKAVAAAEEILEAVRAIQQGGVLDDGWIEKVKLLIAAARTAVDSPAVEPTVEPAASPPASTKTAEDLPAAGTAHTAAAPSIRVDSIKLDALMRLAGELLVARGALPVFAARVEREEATKSMAKEMRDAGAKVSRLADDLQATVMSIRMMPVRQVFQRFPRLVRDIARTLDKNIELHVSGEETELDKTVIDSIGDPLTHIIRNSADHGIESKADRAEQGKPAIGRIDLSALTRGSNVVIEVKDDGKGLDAAKLRRRAVEKGLLTEAAVAAMDDEAAFKIIFAAGFSTVDKVTDLSGRGVGMDVVRTAVEALHRVIHIKSDLGKGTSLRIELPASLLVSKGILVGVSDQELVLPMESIRNMVKIPHATLRTVQGQQIAPVRGTVFPVLSLARALAFERIDDKKKKTELAVAIIDTSSGSYGLVVDQFLGEVEVVVKPLNGVLAKVPEYAGAAIMGDGRTVLVVNTERLFSLQRADTMRPT